jgi:hypothetical protein
MNKKTDEWRPPIKGVLHITGMPDSGKTTFCTGVPGVLPEDIAFFDFDGKSSDMAASLEADGHPFFYYENTLFTQAKRKPIDVFKAIDDKVTELKKKQAHIKVVIFDNWSPTMEEALREKGMSILDQISNISAGQAKAISQITWPATKRFYAQWLQSIAEWADMVFVITHTKPYQIGQTKVPGVYESRGQDVLVQLPVFRLWLLSSSNNAGAPDGLVMKRIKKSIVTTNGITPVNILPPRLTPCTWEKIYSYMDNPVGARDLLPGETPSAWEATLVGGEYLPDQKVAIMAAMELAKSQQSEEEVMYTDLNLTKFVKEHAALGESPVAIFQSAKAANYVVESVKDIIALMQ